MRKSLISFLAVSTSFIILFLIALAVSVLVPVDLSINYAELQKVFAVPMDGFAPEPYERLIYIVNTLLAPILCGCFYVFFARLIKKEVLSKIKILTWILPIVVLYLFGYIAFLGLQFTHFDYLDSSGFVRYPWMTFAVNIVIFSFLLLGRRYGPEGNHFTVKAFGRALYWGVGIFFIILIFLETIFNEYEAYVPHIHFVAYFDSVAQVLLGKHLLLDFSPQYGMYAWILAPIFRLIGLDVLRFTIVMGILKMVIYGCFLVLLYRALDNKLIAFLCFTTICFYTRMRVLLDVSKDPYFQYYPHRMIFPVMLVTLSWFYISSNSPNARKALYVFNSLLSALATLWNPDTGLVVTMAWFGLLLYNELYNISKRGLKQTLLGIMPHIFALAFAYLLVFGLFSISAYSETGNFPNFIPSKDYAQLFFVYGYFMLPMSVIHPWNMVVLAYLLGLYFPIRSLINNNLGKVELRPPQHQELMFITSLMGVGLFNYFIGRSHDFNLIATPWPGYILLALYVEGPTKQILSVLRSCIFSWRIKALVLLRKSFRTGVFIGLLYFFGSSLVSVAGILPDYISIINTRLSQIQKGIPPNLLNDVQFIQQTSQQEDVILIFSDYAPELYLYTNHQRPVNIAGFGEIILVQDIQKIDSFLTDPPLHAKIYWDKRFYDINDYYYKIDPYMYSSISLKATSPDNTLVLFESIP